MMIFCACYNWFLGIAILLVSGIAVVKFINRKPLSRIENLSNPSCCEAPLLIGRSKCYDCDIETVNKHCNTCQKVNDSYTSRLSANNAKASLGRM